MYSGWSTGTTADTAVEIETILGTPGTAGGIIIYGGILTPMPGGGEERAAGTGLHHPPSQQDIEEIVGPGLQGDLTRTSLAMKNLDLDTPTGDLEGLGPLVHHHSLGMSLQAL